MNRLFKQVWLCLCLIFFIPMLSEAQLAKHVILISIDGMHPDMYLDSSWPAPNLRQLLKMGTYADHLLSVFPSYTYPSHTAMLTGALPARSKINFNQPIGSKGEWFWFTSAVKVPTLWQVLKAKGMTTAAVEWPVSVTPDITWDMPEIWDVNHPDDRITEARKYATPGLIEEVEQNATGKLDSTNFNDNYYSLDENAGRAAAYIFKTHKPALLAVHFACVDGFEHDQGRDGDSVRLAVASVDRAIGDILEMVQKSGLQDSTTIILVGDHGFSTINQVFRPNMLLKGLPVRFIASGGSAFLYLQRDQPGEIATVPTVRGKLLIDSVTARLNTLSPDKRKLFRIIYRKELDKMGADSDAILALSATPSLVFSGSLAKAKVANNGPGTAIQQNAIDGLFFPFHGGHHGYDPNIPDMYTGFIADGAGINKAGHIHSLAEPDIAVIIAQLLGIEFNTPDGHLPEGVIKTAQP